MFFCTLFIFIGCCCFQFVSKQICVAYNSYLYAVRLWDSWIRARVRARCVRVSYLCIHPPPSFRLVFPRCQTVCAAEREGWRAHSYKLTLIVDGWPSSIIFACRKLMYICWYRVIRSSVAALFLDQSRCVKFLMGFFVCKKYEQYKRIITEPIVKLCHCKAV